jgi:dienelactone hydrolase
MVVYDIFGFCPQTLQGADILAFSDKEKPYRVFVPDFFQGKAADISWYPPTTEEHGKALGNFFAGVGAPPKAIARIPAVVEAFRASHSNVENVFALGMCWGGKVRTTLLMTHPNKSFDFFFTNGLLLARTGCDSFQQYELIIQSCGPGPSRHA